ncbi:aldo/keto reductase family protein [Amycolatopsis sp. NPDC049688]|uniref:aldo/keto reductase family protein n=1 Tax=Amycolatopsis sp. NPDC049688 TaxID=3154733 RepID=UPI003414C23D
MEYVSAGASGLMVSRLVFGNALTHGDQIDDETARDCVHTALDLGITTFDTADVYADGRAEEVLGRILGGRLRSELVLCSKVGRSKRPDPNAGRLSRKHIFDSVHGSLRRLGTGYLDLYQAHRFDDRTPLEETLRAFADLVRGGEIRYVGVSEWSAAQLRAAAGPARDLGVPLVSNQPQYSILWRVIEAEVIPACDELGIGQLVWSPLAGGVLTGKYRPGGPLPPDSRAATRGGARSIGRWHYLGEDVLDVVGRLAPLAESAGLSLAQLALAWVLKNPSVTSAIVGASRPAQLRENLKALDTVLDDDLYARVNETADPVVRRDPALTEDPLGPAPARSGAPAAASAAR